MRNFADIVAGRPARWEDPHPLILDLHLIRWTVMDSYGMLWAVMDRHWDVGCVGCVGCSLSRCEVMVEFDPGDLPGPLRRLRLGRFRRFG